MSPQRRSSRSTCLRSFRPPYFHTLTLVMLRATYGVANSGAPNVFRTCQYLSSSCHIVVIVGGRAHSKNVCVLRVYAPKLCRCINNTKHNSANTANSALPYGKPKRKMARKYRTRWSCRPFRSLRQVSAKLNSSQNTSMRPDIRSEKRTAAGRKLECIVVE